MIETGIYIKKKAAHKERLLKSKQDKFYLMINVDEPVKLSDTT